MSDPNNTAQPLERGPDGGPLYTETPPEIRAHEPYSGLVAEPWNTATAFLFVLIVVFWAMRLRGRLTRYPFLALSLPILFAGGVGGTLYHGLRNWKGYFLLDVIPIYILGLIVTIYWWIRLGPRLLHLFAMLAVLAFIQLVGMWQLPMPWAINLSYAMLALLILSPLTLVLIRTGGRHCGWVATALVSFGVAWFCRIADYWTPPLLPMGTHWLWHTFGALTTAALTEYVFLIEGVNLRKAASPATVTRP